jgi:Electron transfer DM13
MSKTALAPRLLSIPVVAAILAAGVWVAGGVITNDFHASIALTTVWFALSGVACLLVALRAPAFRVPVFGTYLVVAAVIGGYLGLTTSPGPDLRVRLVPGDSSDGGAPRAVDLGALKGNRGDQQYRIPGDARIGGRSVVIWCRAFSVAFGHAALS